MKSGSLVAFMSVVALVAGCSLFKGGSSDNLGGAVVVTDYYIVQAGNPVGLTAATNSAVVAEVNIRLDQIDNVSDAITGLVPNLKAYIVFGAARDATVSALSSSSMRVAKESPVTLGAVYSVPAGTAIDLVATAGFPALVLGVSVDLTKIEKVPEEISNLVPGVDSYLLFGVVRK
jgi:hypothetical protein